MNNRVNQDLFKCADKSWTRAKRGFTLIELLVVIAIIALLAAILFPVFGRARENARRTSCLSNMKQMGLAMQQYTQDYDENLLPMRVDSNHYFHWGRLLYPYTKSEQIYMCPSNTPKPQGYTFNFHAGGAPDRKVASVILASNLVMFTEATGLATLDPRDAQVFHFQWFGTANIPAFGRIVRDDGPAANVGVCNVNALPHGGRHLEGSNYAFADGHAKWYRNTLGTVSSAIDSGCVSAVTADMKLDGLVMAPHREGVVYSPTATQPGSNVYR